MEQNRSHQDLPGALDDAIFSSFGEDDSIVDRLLSLPSGPRDEKDAARILDGAIAKRAEKMIAERMRARLGSSGDGPVDKA